MITSRTSLLTALLVVPAVLLVGCGEGPDAPPPDAAPAEGPPRSIVDVAVAAGQFSALVNAVEAAGLTETLRNDGPFTVFAPTDGAFSALPEAVVDELMADPDALAEILLYHVVPGEYTLADLRDLTELETVQGGVLRIEDGPRGLTIDGANTLTADIRADNGIIHVMTQVLTPGGG
jgi:uncharacterized surface protein with fasciclin (FAS1) repeats